MFRKKFEHIPSVTCSVLAWRTSTCIVGESHNLKEGNWKKRLWQFQTKKICKLFILHALPCLFGCSAPSSSSSTWYPFEEGDNIKINREITIMATMGGEAAISDGGCSRNKRVCDGGRKWWEKILFQDEEEGMDILLSSNVNFFRCSYLHLCNLENAQKIQHQNDVLVRLVTLVPKPPA